MINELSSTRTDWSPLTHLNLGWVGWRQRIRTLGWGFEKCGILTGQVWETSANRVCIASLLGTLGATSFIFTTWSSLSSTPIPPSCAIAVPLIKEAEGTIPGGDSPHARGTLFLWSYGVTHWKGLFTEPDTRVQGTPSSCQCPYLPSRDTSRPPQVV